MKIIIYTVFTILFYSTCYAVTPTTDRPRILLTPSEVSDLQIRCTTAGLAKTEFDDIKSWVDLHLSDTPSSFP